MTLPDGSVVLRTYTNRSQLHQAKLDGFTLDTRTYDAGGRHSTSTYGNGVVITHAYRTNGALKDDLLASITTVHPGGIPSGQQVGNYSYTWDANRNKLSETITGILSGMGFTPVTYDNEERLTAWSRSDGNQGQTWSLSLVGDWNTHVQTGTVAFTQNRVNGPAHEFNSFTGTNSGTLTYDSKGNNTARPATLATPALNLTWDFGNQLSGVDTNGTPASQEVTFRYDVLGRRVGRVEGASSVVFVQAGQQTVADYDAGQVPSKPNHIYAYGSYIDEPIARRESANIAYFHRNQQYSIVALSNSAGAVVEKYSYTAHGQLSIYNAAGTVLSASAFDNRLTYTGREWDATLALHFFRARWYDPLAGRFISRDPLGYVDGMGFYHSYFSISRIDPFGRKCEDDNCGPDVADWFARQLPLIKGFSRQYWTGLIPATKYKTFFASLKFADNEGLKSAECNTSKACENTVTLCGRCIHVSELGNLAFGYAASETAGWMFYLGFAIEVQEGVGFDSPPDIAAAIIGQRLGDTRESMCRVLSNPYETGEIDFQWGLFINELESINSRFLGPRWRFGDVLGGWNQRHEERLGTWREFMDSARQRMVDENFFEVAGLDKCKPCEVKVSPPNIRVDDTGSVLWR